MKKYAIIGAGIIGSSIAREIRKRNLGDVVVLEKEPELGYHASGRNSGVIHSGINQIPGTYKAKMCLKGSKFLRDYCKKNDVPMIECGTLVVGRNFEEVSRIQELMKMGREAGVSDLRIIDKKELGEREPLAKGLAALLSPTGSIVDSKKLLNTIVNESKSLGVSYQFGEEVKEIFGRDIITENRTFDADFIINCAGLYADKIAHMMDVAKSYRIIPFKGNYVGVSFPINAMIYHPPDLRFPFLGVHLTRRINGNVIAGPTATLSLGRENYNGKIKLKDTIDMVSSVNFRRMVADKEFLQNAISNAKFSLSKKAFINEINSSVNLDVKEEDLSDAFCGIRAQLVDMNGKMEKDIFIRETENSLHILNAVSPGLTCSLAFAEYIVNDRLIPKS